MFFGNLTFVSFCLRLYHFFYKLAWYDYELTSYQKERQETELEKMFEERNQAEKTFDTEHLRKKEIKEPETEWQKSVKSKKGEDYYGKLREVKNILLLGNNLLRMEG